MLAAFIVHVAYSSPSSPSDLYRYFPAEQGNWVGKVWHYITAEPWVGFVMVMCFFHLTWVYMLLAAQMFQVRSCDHHVT